MLGSGLCALGSAYWWRFGAELPGKPVWYLLWPVISFLFVLALDDEAFRRRWLRVTHAVVVGMVSTYPILSDLWNFAKTWQ
jgi:hypothetical protein